MSFNRNQKTVVVLALAIIFIMGIYPPWERIVKIDNFYSIRSIGYHFLFMPPEERHRRYNVTVDLQRLYLQGFLVVVAGTSVIVFFGRGNVSRRKDKKPTRELRKKESPAPTTDIDELSKEFERKPTVDEIYQEFVRPKSNKHK